ncbi:MAG: DUF2946 family protein [Pseudomonadota bacterium]
MSWLMAFAVLMGGLIPTGFMPVLAQAGDEAAGFLTMVICTADGSHTVTIDADGNLVDPSDQLASGQPGSDNPSSDQNHRDSSCAFALAGLALAPQALDALVTTPRPRDTALTATAERVTSIARPGIQARGPPRS